MRFILASAFICLSVVLAIAQVVVNSPLRLENSAIYMGDQQWSWQVFLTSDNATAITEVREVTYYLHSTFREPIQKVTVRGVGPKYFAYSATGWGTFKIKAVLKLANGKTKTMYHELKFNEVEPSTRLDVRVGHKLSRITKGKYPWTLYIAATPEVISQIKCVQYQLDATTIKESCNAGDLSRPFSVRGMSGSDAVINLKIFLADGTVQTDRYHLRFVRDATVKR